MKTVARDPIELLVEYADKMFTCPAPNFSAWGFNANQTDPTQPPAVDWESIRILAQEIIDLGARVRSLEWALEEERTYQEQKNRGN